MSNYYGINGFEHFFFQTTENLIRTFFQTNSVNNAIKQKTKEIMTK